MPWHGAAKRGHIRRDQSSTTATVHDAEDSLDDNDEDQESDLSYEKMNYSDESSEDLNDHQYEDSRYADNSRNEKVQDDLSGEERTQRRTAVKRQESQRVARRRNSITVISTGPFDVEAEVESSRRDLDATSQHSSTNLARNDRRRTIRPRRHSLGYAVPALAQSTEPSEFKNMLQKRLERIEKQKFTSDSSFDRSQSNPYGYEGEEWHDSSSNIAFDMQGKRRCGRRSRRHSIGSVSGAEGDSSLLKSKGTTSVDPDYGYEDPDAPEPSCDDSAPARRQQRNAPRRVRRLSVGQCPAEKESHNDDLNSLGHQQRESVQRRKRRSSMHV